MSPDRSKKALIEHAEIFANGVKDGEINGSAVFGLLGSLADQWCIPECRFAQFEEAMEYYEFVVGEK